MTAARSRGNVTTRSLVAYILLAHALAWLVSLPLWLGPGLRQPVLVAVVGAIMMFTPTAATLLVLRRGERRPWRELARTVGLGVGRSPGRLFAWLGLVAAAVYVVVLGATLTSTLLGQFDLDPGFSGMAELLRQQGAAPQGIPLGLMAALLLGAALLNGAINTIPALGEEIGWRGFLFPELQARFGTGAALVATGIIWGLWHAPLILLGYNYPLHPVLGLLAFCVVCTLLTGILAWVRQRSGSVWPAAYGHGLFNALFGTALLVFQRAGAEVDALHGTVLGWSGWPVPVILVAALLIAGAYTPLSPNRASSAGASRSPRLDATARRQPTARSAYDRRGSAPLE
ncbi:MAG TPA: CPBP family intramembrane metalloprotease [Propionibacterium sp.]|nr:CPBP family intramembrane metalloprotease [Propionibacterium sp.]